MSDAQTRTSPCRSAAKLNMDKLGDVLVGKGQPPSPPAGAEQRGTTAPPVTPQPASTEPAVADPKRKRPKGISTSLEVPPYLMENIAEYLRANGGHNMRTLLFAGLSNSESKWTHRIWYRNVRDVRVKGLYASVWDNKILSGPLFCEATIAGY